MNYEEIIYETNKTDKTENDSIDMLSTDISSMGEDDLNEI